VLRRVEAAHHGFQYSDAEARAIRRAVGPFRGAKGLVAGELSYVTRTPSGRSRTRDVEFEAPISLVQRIQRPPFTPPAGPSYYNVRLRVSGSGYRQIVGISEALRPGGVKQFEIRVFAQRSSVHSFRVHLKYGAREIVTAPTELRLFVPRSHQIPQADDDVSSSGAS